MNRMKPTESYNKQDVILLAGFISQCAKSWWRLYRNVRKTKDSI